MANETVILRRDADEYVEGLTYGQGIQIKLSKLSWMLPGETYTSHVLNEAGQVMIPVYETKTAGGVTDLCAVGAFSKAQQRFESLQLDKKTGAELDGCFSVAGLVPMDWERSLNNASLRVMAMDAQAAVEAAIEADATDSVMDVTGLTPYQMLNKLRTEFYGMNGLWPTVALVSLDFYNAMLDAQVGLQNISSSSAAYIEGAVGTVAGMVIVPTNMTSSITLLVPESLHIATAGNIKQIPGFGGAIGAVDLAEGNAIGFSAGMLSKTDVQPTYIGAKTYIHKPFGVKVIPELTLQLPSHIVVGE